MAERHILDVLSRDEFRTALELARRCGFRNPGSVHADLRRLAQDRIVVRRRADRCGRPYEYRLAGGGRA